MRSAFIYKDSFMPTTKRWRADVVDHDGTMLNAWAFGHKTKTSLVAAITAIDTKMAISRGKDV